MVLATSGPRRVPHDASIAAHRNVGDVERWISVLGGSALAVIGANRRGAAGLAMALAGAELIRRGATGHCLAYDMLGVSTATDAMGSGARRVGMGVTSAAATVNARLAVKVERTVTVERSPAEVYAFWKEPRNLPQFMQLLDTVEPIDATHARWIVRTPGGRTLSWVAEVFNDVPNELIAWKSVGDADVANAGSVHFRPLAGGRVTEVKVVADYEPPGGLPGHMLVKLFGRDPDTLLREDLQRFKRLMESGRDPATPAPPST